MLVFIFVERNPFNFLIIVLLTCLSFCLKPDGALGSSICSTDGELQIVFLCMEALAFLVFLKDRVLIALAGIYWFIPLLSAPDRGKLYSIGCIEKKLLHSHKFASKNSTCRLGMTFVTHIVPPMILQLVLTFLLNYPMHIAVHTSRHCASLSISRMLVKLWNLGWKVPYKSSLFIVVYWKGI